MAYEKQNWISYDDNKTEEQNIQDGAVVTAERMNHIEDGVEAQATKIEFDSHLDDKGNPHEVTAHQVGALTAEETSAHVIDQVIGKESNMKAMSLDFKDKVSGSLVENVNKIASSQYNSLLPPSNGSWLEFPQANIDKVKALDKELFSINEKANGYMQQVLICYDVLGYLINRLGEQFFTDRGAKDVPSQVAIIRSMISDLAGNVWGYGLGPAGNKMTFRVWTHLRSKWEVPLTTSNNTVTRIKRSIGSTNDYIDTTGKMYFLVNAEPSDGVTASTLNIDYVSLQFDLTVSANDHIQSMIAADRGENLGNVDNYKTANQTEAESGTATDKFMTPLRTKQFYDQQSPELASEMINEIIRRSPQVLELTVADKTITNSSSDLTPLTALRNQVNTDPTRFLSDGNVIYISKAGTYTFDLACSINNKGVGTYFGFQLKQSNGDLSFPGPAIKTWAGDKAPVIISATTTFEAGDQLTIYTYPANAKYEINNLRIRMTYRGDDSV